MIKKIYITVTLLITLIAGAAGGYQYGKHQGAESTLDEEWTSWDLTQAEKELNAIYGLLAAEAFTGRMNMNMSFKTQQYIKKVMEAQSIDPEIDKEVALEYLGYIVDNMPELEGGNKTYFDTFYREPLEKERLKNK